MTDLTRDAIIDADLDTFRDILFGVLNDTTPPNIDFFKNVLGMVLATYDEEDEDIRQKAADGQPGGLIDLRSDKPVLLLPDLHARRYFLRNVLNYVPQRIIPQATEEESDEDHIEETIDEPKTIESSEHSQTSDSEADCVQENISVMDYVPPSDIEVAESPSENITAEKDIADKLIEQIHNIKEEIIKVEETDLVQSSELAHLTELNKFSVLELLEQNRLIVLCVGDGVHGEASFAARWREAYSEVLDNFDVSPNMDAEIADSFNLMIAVMLLKIRYPKTFHFLKGNHENICNETGGGNYAFAKFANEGQMVLTYFRVKYDLELLALYAEFERSLPLFAVGWNFLASHAEPASFYDYDHILNYHINEDVILGLTWTDNHQSMPGTIDVMLDYYIPDNGDGSYYFGGHRPIKGIYYRINGDRYVQFHNPWLQIVGFIDQSEPIDLDRDIIQIGETDDSEGCL